jgi:hypothetical protein
MYEPFVPNLSHRKKKIMEALSKLNEYLVTSLSFKNIIVDAGMSPEDAAVEADKLKPKTAKPAKSKLPPDVARWKSSYDNCESEYKLHIPTALILLMIDGDEPRVSDKGSSAKRKVINSKCMHELFITTLI